MAAGHVSENALYRIALVPAPIAYGMGLSFTHKTPIVDRYDRFLCRSDAALLPWVLKVNRHISDRFL